MNSQARMKGQLRRLKREPELLKEYDRTVKEQAEQGIIEQVTSLEKANKVHYLPHQAVIRKDAVTPRYVLYTMHLLRDLNLAHRLTTVCMLDHHLIHYFTAY